MGQDAPCTWWLPPQTEQVRTLLMVGSGAHMRYGRVYTFQGKVLRPMRHAATVGIAALALWIGSSSVVLGRTLQVPRFDGDAARSLTCVRKAKAPGTVTDCWVGRVLRHRFTFMTWNHNGFPLGYELKTSSGNIYRVAKGPYTVYEFSGSFVCWTQQAGAAAGAVNLLNGRGLSSSTSEWRHTCVTPMSAYRVGYVLGLRGHRWSLYPKRQLAPRKGPPLPRRSRRERRFTTLTGTSCDARPSANSFGATIECAPATSEFAIIGYGTEHLNIAGFLNTTSPTAEDRMVRVRSADSSQILYQRNHGRSASPRQAYDPRRRTCCRPPASAGAPMSCVRPGRDAGDVSDQGPAIGGCRS